MKTFFLVMKKLTAQKSNILQIILFNPIALLLILSSNGASAQNFTSVWAADGNTTGASQNPLNLGNWSDNTSAPQYKFYTTDQGSSPLQIHSTRWAGGLLLTRDDPNGLTNLMTVNGWNGFGTNLSLFNQSNQVGVLLNSAGTSYFNGGNLGIGTTNTGSFKLAVEGKIGAREINVTLTDPWPDYVFAKEYKLLSLSDLDEYIKVNSHLPEMPSSAQVEKEGVNLGDMNARLLQKIEELTLHLIEINKRVEELEIINKGLQEKNKENK